MKGYCPNSLPEHYTIVAPADISIVAENLLLIEKILKDNTYGTYDFVDHVTDEIYEHYITPLLNDLHFVLSGNSIRFDNPLDESMCRSDVEYLEEMRQMDLEIKQNIKSDQLKSSKFTLTKVVPIAGLLMARITIIECELRTALEIWAKKLKFSFPKMEKDKSESTLILFPSFLNFPPLFFLSLSLFSLSFLSFHSVFRIHHSG